MYTVEFLPVAKEDLTAIAEYIGKTLKNPQAAYDLMAELMEVAGRLKEYPYEYQAYNPIKPLKYEYRRATIKNYVMFYWIDEKKKVVTVARVVYGRRKYSDLLM